MPAPAILAPLAWKAAQFGAVAVAAWLVSRRRRAEGPREIWRERVLDEVTEGLECDAARGDGFARADAAGRLRRVFRYRRGAPVEIDMTVLARFRVRRAD